jgi:hypothetical protein
MFHFILKLSNDFVRSSAMENSSFEDLHRRMCAIEREKDQALARLENREVELRKLQSMLV